MLVGGKGPGSDGDSIQAEYLGCIPEQPRAELNDPAGDRVEILHLVGLEFLEELPQALDEAALLLADVLVGIAKLQEDLVIWMGRGAEVSVGRGGLFCRPGVSSPYRVWQDAPGGAMAPKCWNWQLSGHCSPFSSNGHISFSGSILLL